MIEVRRPGEGSLVTRVPVQGADEVRAATSRVRGVQGRWAALSPGTRARRMEGLARVLEGRAEEIADRIQAETGKPRAEALGEVVVSADLIQFYCRAAPRHLRRRRVGSGWLVGKSAWVEPEPYGVVGAITPWNYPFILAMDCVSPALFAGNGVVVKPSELTPWTTLLIPDLVADAGLPEGLVEVVTGDGSTGASLIASGVHRLIFTGSAATGKKVMRAAADALIPVTLELGGKDPALVLEDADLERAARGVVYGAFYNAGQTCISVERAYVAAPVYEEFVRRVTELAGSMRTGTGPDVDMGPMVSEEQVRIVEEHVRDARERGARVLTGGRRAEEGSQVYLPTVLVDLDDSMTVMREESFGPLLPVIRVEDEEEAVRRANELGYGLFASVWTKDTARGRRIARRLAVGGVSVNDVLSHYAVPGLPMGGTKESGYGSRRGIRGLDDMTRVRTLLVHRLGLTREPWWFPYSDAGTRLVRAVLDWRAWRGLGGLLRAARRIMGRGG